MIKGKPAIVLPTRKVIVERGHKEFEKARNYLCEIALLREVHKHVMIYEITKEGVWYGCWRGIKVQEMIQRLKEVSRAPLEEKLVDYIKNAASRYGRITVKEYNEKRLECVVKDSALYLKIKERIQTRKQFKDSFKPVGKRRFLISRSHLGRIEHSIMRLFDTPIEKNLPISSRHSPFYREKSSQKPKEIVAQALQRIKVQGETLDDTNLKEKFRSLHHRIYQLFETGGEESAREKAIEFSGLDPEEEFIKSRREQIKEELLKLESEGESLSYKNLMKNHSALLRRIGRYFTDYPGEGNGRYKAIKYAGLDPQKVLKGSDLWSVMGETQQREWIKKRLRQWVKDDKSPAAIRNQDSILYSRIKQKFKDFPGDETILGKALRYAEIDPQQVQEVPLQRTPDEDLKSWITKRLRQWIKDQETTITSQDLRNENRTLYRKINKVFKNSSREGSPLFKALQDAGIDPQEVLTEESLWRAMRGRNQRRKWLREELRKKAKNGELEGISYTPLYQRACKEFKGDSGSGSAFDKALRYAEIDPETHEVIKDSSQEEKET